ncbi:SusC/RagA family TonB-linked outer membrane protein [Mucilaginibacter terrae]|uniref:SusC/RagA family TonB-linked outer membrane protein n=1 Tax=Mucilaginibacter terrae TaxID=1955052 RepID=UPI003633DC0E
MKKILLVAMYMCMVMGLGYAQNRQVAGTIIDAGNKDPLVGANITVKGTKLGTTTDVRGNFKLTLVQTQKIVLVVTYLGYTTQEVSVENNQPLNINLQPNATALDEVVAIGYANVQRRDLTGSVSSINAKQLKDIPINSAEQALAGRLAGVQIVASEGSPNAEVKIRVRGGGSITQDNSPLYIIDGIQVEDGLLSLSPQDIESIDVLKDASSTSIYGSRGANGVIIVTTKGGKEGATTVNYNNIFGINKLSKKLKVMDPYNFVEYQYERSRGNATDSTTFATRYGNDFPALSRFKNEEGLDWQERMLGRNAFMQTHNVSISGGTKTIKFNTSYSFNKQQGILVNSDYQRHVLNSKFDHNVSSKFRVAVNVRYTDITSNGSGTSDPEGASLNTLRNIVKYRPIVPAALSPDEEDEDYFEETNVGNGLGIINPVVLQNARYRQGKTTITNYNGYANYNFTPALSLRSTIGFNFNSAETRGFNEPVTLGAVSSASISTLKTNTLNQSNVLTYDNSKVKTAFNKKNSINVLLGQEIFTSSREGLQNQFREFPAGTTSEIAFNQLNLGVLAATFPRVTVLREKLLSFFTRANYTYDNRYLATFTMRADASSKFADGYRWGYFPSGSLAWRVTEEKFLKNKFDALSNLKLRLSYGTSGNNRIAPYSYLTVFQATALYPLNENLTSIGYAPDRLANPTLQWETTVARNIGLDLGLFNDRIQVTMDAYQNTINDALIAAPVSVVSGYTSQFQNIGATENKGLELQINASIIQKKNFTWSTNFNISTNSNKIKKLASGQESYLQNSGWAISGTPADFIVQVGKPVGSIYGYVNEGYYTLNDFDYNATNNRYTLKEGIPNPVGLSGLPQPGSIRFADVNGDGVLTTNDRSIIGNANPDFYGGLNQMFTYKNFDASVFVNFQLGNDILNANKIEFTNGYAPSTNMIAIMENRWRTVDANGVVLQKVVTSGGTSYVVGAPPEQIAAANANANIWMPLRGSTSYYISSWAVENGSFLRINNITLGYTFSNTLIKKANIKRLRLYATLNNLAVITKYTGYDPEVDTRRTSPLTPGVDYSAYPRSRNYIFGLNVSF